MLDPAAAAAPIDRPYVLTLDDVDDDGSVEAVIADGGSATLWVAAISFDVARVLARHAFAGIPVSICCGRLDRRRARSIVLGTTSGIQVWRYDARRGLDLIASLPLPTRAEDTTPSAHVAPITPLPVRARRRQSELSPRERQVVQLAARGASAKDIARLLRIGHRTVETHMSHAYAKLGIRSRIELAIRASELALD